VIGLVVLRIGLAPGWPGSALPSPRSDAAQGGEAGGLRAGIEAQDGDGLEPAGDLRPRQIRQRVRRRRIARPCPTVTLRLPR